MNSDPYRNQFQNDTQPTPPVGSFAGGAAGRPPQAPRPAGNGVPFDRPNNEDVTPRSYRQTNGEVPRAARPASTGGTSEGAARRPAAHRTAPRTSASGVSRPDSEALRKRKAEARKKKKRAMRRKSHLQSLLLVVAVLAFVFVASYLIKIPIMGCVNDLLAIDRDSNEIRVVVQDGMHVDDVIDLLADKGLLYSADFCKLAAKLLDYSNEDVYLEGTYQLSPDMGLEGMLKEIMASGLKQNTVMLTFPEGYTVDQIVAKLSENNVASATALYQVINGPEIREKYEFLQTIVDPGDRYCVLEGYLYPDTYEFYIGEEPASVIEKFLNNFQKRWTSEFDDLASELGMTTDEIVTMASILEKEAFDAQQMPLISSILYNRVRSSSFPFINCDSTTKYLEAIQPNVPTEEQFQLLKAGYDTYEKTGLPVGAICNPGADAIKAALHPDSTDYYYFLHDSDGKIYVARTAEEHEANQYYVGE